MTTEVNSHTPGYWYGEDSRVGAVDVLNALRHYRAAESAAQRRARESIGIGENAMAALRMLVDAHRAGRPVNAKHLAEHLDITAASTSALVDRLVSSGHVVRVPDPTDRRGVLLSPTGQAMTRALEVIAELDARTREVVEHLPSAEMAVVVEFLDEMAAVVDEIEAAEAAPRGDAAETATPVDAAEAAPAVDAAQAAPPVDAAERDVR